MLLNANNLISETQSFLQMYYSLKCVLYFVIFLSCNNTFTANYNLQGMNTDTVFIQWNQATLKSLQSRIHSASDNSERSIYKNRILAFKAAMEIDADTTINTQSIRYQFLKTLLKDTAHFSANFYVIEAERSGEMLEIINYVIYPNDIGFNIATYNFERGEWRKGSNIKRVNVRLPNDLEIQYVNFGLGFNQEDIIVTKFNESKITASAYYVYTTLSNSSILKEIVFH